MTEFEILDALRQAGVVFIVSVPDRRGLKKVEATPYDLIEFTSDRERFFAKCHRVSRDAYVAWINDAFSVRCSFRRDGFPCENIVPGGEHVSARTYIAMQGARCFDHP